MMVSSAFPSCRTVKVYDEYSAERSMNEDLIFMKLDVAAVAASTHGKYGLSFRSKTQSFGAKVEKVNFYNEDILKGKFKDF